MATATATNSTPFSSSVPPLMEGQPSENLLVARYQLESRTIFGEVMEFHPEWIEGQPVEYGKAYSIFSGGMAEFRNVLVRHRREFEGIYLLTVFADQGDGIPELMDVRAGEPISVIATEFSSRSGRFVNTNRVWSVLDPDQSDLVHADVPRCTRLALGGPALTETLLPQVQGLVANGSLPMRLCLNKWTDYIP